MGAYQLSLQGSSGFNPAARLEASQGSARSAASSQDGGSSHGRRSRGNSPVHAFGFFETSKRVASQPILEGLLQLSPPRHSTACCDGLSERREAERRLSSQKMRVTGAAAAAVQRDSSEHSSFRSEDSESLALWEEKEPALADQGWMKQSPRWLGAMRRFGRSSPVHPKYCSSRDTPRVSLDLKPSQQFRNDASNKPSWYAKKIRSSGESRSARSPTGAAPNLVRRNSELAHSSQWDHDDSMHDSSFSRLTNEDTRFTASAVAWDISSRRDSLVAQPRPANGLAWEIPADATHEKFVDANSIKSTTKDSLQSVTDKSVGLSDGEQCEAFFDGQSEYASCRTFTDHGSESNSKSAELVNVIDFVAPLLTEPAADAAPAVPRVPFKWEAAQGKRADEVAPATETPRPPSFLSNGGFSSFESKSAPLDGLCVLLPKTRPPRLPIKEDSVNIPDSFFMKSRSWNDAEGRAAHDHRLFTKLRKSVFGSPSLRGPSPLGLKNVEFVEASSPRSILRGPDDGSVPSSNPSLRSDPGTPAFSAIPNSSTSQSMSSCSASFDLNEYETTYDLNSSAARIIVESRRVSLSFRDFGPARPSGGEDQTDDMSEPTNIELEWFNANKPGSLPEAMQSPELWTATLSARYSDAPESPGPDQPAAVTVAASLQQHEVQVPIVIQKSRSHNGEFTARLGVMFSPLRLISSHESNHSCFVASTRSPPHEVDDYASTLEFLSTSELHSSSAKGRKAKSSWTHGDKVKSASKSSTHRHASDDSQTVMMSISKTIKKFLAKVTVKRSTGKGKSRISSPILETLPPATFHFAEVN